MRSFDRRIDVSAALGASAPREIAATIHLPDEDGPPPTCLLFAFPGAGYNRQYFDLRWTGSPDRYSQAAHHVQRGIALAVCDHLGTGDSDAGESLSLDQIAAANARVASSIGDALANGTLLAGVKPLPARRASNGPHTQFRRQPPATVGPPLMLDACCRRFSACRNFNKVSYV
jgi:hypothetical protein